MSKPRSQPPPPDQRQREQALDPDRSILVQAPAGSGKTTLLTQRFLSLLEEVEEPGQVVAITFTNAAAAEMRNRILDELRNPDSGPRARRVLERASTLGWKLLDLPGQLRISTIDSFCRELALQQPLLSGFGGGLAIADQPDDLYRHAARQTIERIGDPGNPALGKAVESLLKWRDNNWQELEDLLVKMLAQRDRWMQNFLLSHNPDWEALRERLERPFANAVRKALAQVSKLIDEARGGREEALELARFACSQTGGEKHRELAEMAEFPCGPFVTPAETEEAHRALLCLGNLVLTLGSTLRKTVDKNLGFPADRKAEKARILKLIASLAAVSGLEPALAAVRELPPARYIEEDWEIVKACFTLLRHAVAQLKVVFAESGAVDFIEVAQIAQNVLRGEDGLPTDAAFAVADGIHHLLVDEFQDTSRRQHQMLASLIGAWEDRPGRTLFAVGDPMQSIYFFRDADTELFGRAREIGLEIPGAGPLTLEPVALSANFRSAPGLVDRLNEVFERVFEADDGSSITFSHAIPAREDRSAGKPAIELHLKFEAQAARKKQLTSNEALEGETRTEEQLAEIVELIRSHQPAMEEARAAGKPYRVAVLGRARTSLVPIAQALRQAKIPFRAVDLEKLAARPEILDALGLARALLNPQDRVAWLGVLRAPWCGLTLEDLHTLTSADDPGLLARPVPDLLDERLGLLSESGQSAAQRVLAAIASVPAVRASLPSASIGTWLQQIWLGLGAADCCDATARANLDLLWSCLDRLPDGEPDLLGPALDDVLDKLTALPDPAASSDRGVQLMTIHKSKGLEFEVVIVPDLQARTGAGRRGLLSWLERGLKPETGSNLEEPEHSGEITEFLIAPLQPKGEDRGKSKAWVDRVYKERESQENRRVLYVAATRAREELHLFARLFYKVEASGEYSLVGPSAGLLATAWPALEEEVRARFNRWNSTQKPGAGPAEADSNMEIESLAASADNNLLGLPSTRPSDARPTLLRRLPKDYNSAKTLDAPGLVSETWESTTPHPYKALELGAPSFPRLLAERVGDAPASPPQPAFPTSETVSPRLYARHEGGVLSRALGTAVHTFIEELARLRTAEDWEAARVSLRQHEPRVASQIRAAGIAPAQAAPIAAEALRLALSASHDPIAQWILAPRSDAGSEVRWTGVVGSALTNVRVDRVFRAGLIPQSDGQDAWWIVDYKTAQAENADAAAALPDLRKIFAPQLEAYAQVLRNLHGANTVVRAGLYYPRMLSLDWWEL